MAGLNNIGLQALNANQLALNITGQNIANVNSPGYSRQSVDFTSRSAPELGVDVQGVARTVDQFANRQLWTDTAAAAGSDAFVFYANQLDDTLAGSDTSVSSALDEFFGALQTGIDDPASLPNREVVLAEADALARRFNDLDDFFDRRNSDITTKVEGLVAQASSMASQVADLNEKIRFAVSRNEPANELKDQREELVRQLSEIIGVTVQSSGENDDVNLFVGNGQPLVIGNNASSLSVQQGDPDPDDLVLVVNVADRQIEVGQEVTTGEVGGLLSFRDEMLVPAWNELGRLAVVFADTINTQHRQGMDLDNEQGIDLFSDLNSSGTIRAFSENQASLETIPSVTLTDTSALKASDYTLTFTGAESFTIVRESDGRRFTQDDFAQGVDTTEQSLEIELDGMTIKLDSEDGFIKGDQFLIKPVRNGAEEISLNINSGRQLALASPVRGTAAVDNSGVAQIGDIEITDPDNLTFSTDPGSLTPPVEIVFNAGDPTTFDVLDMSDPDNPQPYQLDDGTFLTGQTYTSGEPIQLNGFAVTIEKQPDAGDRFSFVYNTDGVSDNSNAFKMSELQQASSVEGGASYQDAYGLLIERVGTETSVAQLNAEANETVLKNSTAVRDGISGVNLDEEAANIIKFQQAYQAAAQLISASRTLFDTLLNASRG